MTNNPHTSLGNGMKTANQNDLSWISEQSNTNSFMISKNDIPRQP
jgi:hypothetical protein